MGRLFPKHRDYTYCQFISGLGFPSDLGLRKHLWKDQLLADLAVEHPQVEINLNKRFGASSRRVSVTETWQKQQELVGGMADQWMICSFWLSLQVITN